MPVSPARAAAFDILLRVDREQAYVGELLHSARFKNLSPADHALAMELTMGVLRWRSLLDHELARHSSQKLDRLDGEVLTALRLAAYQLHFLSRVPARAAIFESVELVKKARKRSAAPFVNAVLRKLAGEASASPFSAEALARIHDAADVKALADCSAHPEWLITRWVGRFGLEKARLICASNQTVPATAVWLADSEASGELSQAGIELAHGSLVSDARTVLAGDVTHTKAYRQSRVAIQDEGSQLVALLVGRGERILDCCAAPGGKTRVIAHRNPRSLVAATELHPHRARLLRAMAASPSVRVVAADARSLPFSSRFERILADVPCSGTGTLAHHPEIKWRLTPADLHDLQHRQTAILQSALAQLADGGRLVYSTCSLEREENEAVVEAALAAAPEFFHVDCREVLADLRRSGDLCVPDIDSLLDGPYLRTIPGVHRCDGFFAAVLARRS